MITQQAGSSIPMQRKNGVTLEKLKPKGKNQLLLPDSGHAELLKERPDREKLRDPFRGVE